MTVDKNQCSSNKKYARLRNLWHQLREAKNHDTNLDIIDLRGLILLKEARPQVRKHIIDRIANCNKELKRLTRTIAQPKHRIKARLSETDILRLSLPASRIRENAKLLYWQLVRHWKCEGHEPHTSVKLRLATHRGINEEAKFNMLFCTRSGSPLKWQQGEAKVQFTERQSSESRKQKRITWSDDIINKPQETTVHHERSRVEDVCNLVHETAKMNSLRLNLVVENDVLWFMTASSITDDDHNQEFMSLGDFLNKSSANNVKKTGSLILMVILSNAFLHFHGGPWFTRDWSKRNIYLSWSKDQVIPNLARPYISTKCDPREELPESKELDEVRASLLVHPYPSILALGILLLEIHLGRPIESERTSDDLNDRGSLDPISYLSEAEAMLEECRGDSSKNFEEAVEACLDIFTFLKDSRQNMSLDDLVFRAKIHVCIVKPLEEELKAVSGFSVDELDSLASSKNLFQKIVLRRQKGVTSPSAAPNFTTTANSTAAPSQMAVHQLGVYGDSGAVGTAEQKHSQADDWFCTLNERVHPLIPGTEQSAIEASGCEGICTRQGKVRIAILDTGISLPEEHIWNFEDRIKDFKSWLRTNEDDKTEDFDGHGTHAAALLLKTAPNANIYIARVFRDRKETKGNITAGEIHRRVANAITYAVEEWKVDIITMSFGFDEPVPIIEDAINLADREKIVMLAAASNNGGNDDIAWPARLDKVICIHSTDSYGNPSDFTPTECSYSDNFGILGQAVKSSWPPHLKQGTEIRKSGSSIATPIAVGIAAIVLDFLRHILSARAHRLPESDAVLFRKVRTTAGMSCIFRLMATKRRGYDYIAPWSLLDVGPNGLESDAVYGLIRKKLKGQS